MPRIYPSWLDHIDPDINREAFDASDVHGYDIVESHPPHPDCIDTSVTCAELDHDIPF